MATKTESKKRGTYIVESYDSKIRKVYRNFKSADKYVRKLAINNVMCALYESTENGFVEIEAC